MGIDVAVEPEFDAYLLRRGFTAIAEPGAMAAFLIRAARRYHAVDREIAALPDADIDAGTPAVMLKDRVWSLLLDLFGRDTSDLRVFFSELDGFGELAPAQRKRWIAVADALVGSARDARRIEVAKRLLIFGGLMP